MGEYYRGFRMLYEEHNGTGNTWGLTPEEYEKFLADMEKTVGGAFLRLGEELRGLAHAIRRGFS